MKRLVTSDWQLIYNQRDMYRLDFVKKEIPELIHKYKPDQLLMLGDLCEEKDQHPASLVNEIVEFFCSLATEGCDIVILQGNHDFLHKEYPFFKFLENYKAIKWISKPTVMEGCLYLPHTRNHKQDWKGVDFDGHDFIFAHNIFEGVKANGQSLSGISTSIFPDSSCVIAGDVHEPQTLDVVTYVGSPFLTDFGDDFQPRVLLLDDLRIKSIKVYGPQKRVIEVGVDGNVLHAKNWNEGDIVKIKAHLEMKDVAEWDKKRSELINWTASQNLVLYTIVPIVAYDNGARARPVKGEKKSDDAYLQQFVKRNGIDEATAKAGQEILDSE